VTPLEIFVKALVLHLRTHEKHFVEKLHWSAEGFYPGYTEVSFSMDNLIAEIAEFTVTFQGDKADGQS
jgi:hypothetical protein